MTSSEIPTPASARSNPDDPRDVDPDAEQEASGGRGVEAPASPEAELAALRDRWLRAEAELQNYRRRAQRDVEEARRCAEERGLLDVIESLDDLERALTAARDAGGDAAWVQGVELVAQRMRDSLSRAGVTAVSPVNEPFDPRFHEAMLQMPAPEGTPPGTVLRVERTGYRRGDRMLRAARVVAAAEPGNA